MYSPVLCDFICCVEHALLVIFKMFSVWYSHQECIFFNPKYSKTNAVK